MVSNVHPSGTHQLDTTAKQESVMPDTLEARRLRRLAALKIVAGLWSNRPDIPADGLDYQRDMRAEWP